MKNILFLETGTPTIAGGAGGSVYSLLEIVKGIRQFENNITVLFYNKFNIAEKFSELGCKVIIKNNNDQVQNYSPKRNKKKISNSRLIRWVRFNLGVIKIYPNVKFIMGVLKENQIDILHCNDRLSTNFAGVLAAKILRKKVIVHQRQYESSLPLLIQFVGRRVDKYFAVSNSISENLLENLKSNKREPEVLFNWISSKNNYEWKEHIIGKNILWFGRIVPWKGTHLLIDLAEIFIKEKINFNKIILYGDADSTTNDYYLSLKSKINNKKLDKYFEFRGYMEFEEIDLSEFFAYFHTSVAPEPFGRTIIESMMNGLPAFATNLGGVKDIINDGINGFLYEIDDLSATVKKIRSLEDSSLYSKIVHNAKKTVEEKFSGLNQIPRLINVYENL